MRQFPLFVDSGNARVAAIVTVPDCDPRGVVLSLAATGRHNVIGSTLCAHLSQRVVEQGLASARLDYTGTGDSPGLVSSWTPSDVAAAVRQAEAVLETTMSSLGVTRFAVVGTCYGTRVALSLVPTPGCVSAVCLAPPILDYGGFSRASRRIGARKTLSALRGNALVRRLAAPLRGTVRARKPAAPVIAALDRLGQCPIAFLYGKDPWEDHFDPQVQEVLDGLRASLPAEHRDRFELRMLPWGPLTTFDILPPGDKEAVVGAVLPLICGPFDETPDVRVAMAASATAAGVEPGPDDGEARG